MKRKRRRRDSQALSLFPFLAVLVCTMGVLIVLLVFAVKSADQRANQAKRDEQDQVQAQLDDLKFQLETEELRIEGLSQLRPDVNRRLKDERLKRSHLQEEIRKLRAEAERLKLGWQKLDEDLTVARQSQEGDRERIKRLHQQIAAKTDELARLREQLGSRPSRYSIVPTKSKNGTLRRPIYVECTAQGIFLRPSNIKLDLDDFAVPILPGNPLDAALLATREYWNKYHGEDKAGEPYPLLVIRPGGATAYAIARRAMQSWDDEFGYELVEADKQLDFGTPDENLARILAETIDASKRRQRQLVALNRNDSFRAGSSSGSNRVRRNVSSRMNASGDDGNHLPPSFRDGPAAVETESNSVNQTLDTKSQSNPLRQSQIANQTPRARSGVTGQTIAGRSNETKSAAAGVNSLAKTRGADWALPTRTPGATAYRRPIRVVCEESQFLVFSGDVDQPPSRIEVTSSMESSVDNLVDQIWRQIEAWGMAEAGGYWKPVLRLAASPAGKERAAQLATMLEGSGLEIEGNWR